MVEWKPGPSTSCWPSRLPRRMALMTSSRRDFCFFFFMILIEKQISLGLSLRNKECGGTCILVKGEQIGVGENIYVVNENELVVGEQASCFFQSSTRFEKHVCFVAELYVDAKRLLGLYEINDLLSKVMDVDDNVGHPDVFESFNQYLYKRFPIERHHRLGHCVGEWFESCAEPGCKDESIHEG